MKNCVGILFVCYDATELRIANENQVWEKIIHDRDCKTTRVFNPESHFC